MSRTDLPILFAALAGLVAASCEAPSTTDTAREGADGTQEDQLADQRLLDTLYGANARIDMAAREALLDRDEWAEEGRDELTHEDEMSLGQTARALEYSAEAASADLRSRKEVFTAEARERLARAREDIESMRASGERMTADRKAKLERDRQRVEANLEHLVDMTAEGYETARDAIAHDVRTLEAELRELRKDLEDAV